MLINFANNDKLRRAIYILDALRNNQISVDVELVNTFSLKLAERNIEVQDEKALRTIYELLGGLVVESEDGLARVIEGEEEGEGEEEETKKKKSKKGKKK